MAWLKRRQKTYYLCWLQNGKENRTSLRTSKKSIADRELKAFEAKQLEGRLIAPVHKNPQCDDFWELYSSWVRRNRARRTLDAKKYYWDYLIENTGANCLADITPEVFVDHLEWHKREGRGPYTIKNAITNIRTIFNWAIRYKHYTGQDPTFGENRPDPCRDRHSRLVILSPEDLQRLLSVCRGPLRYVVLLGAFQGLRKHEIAFFKTDWIDREAKMIRIGKGECDEFTLKTGKRAVPISDAFLRELPNGKESFLFTPKRYVNGNALYRVDYKRGLIAALEKCKLPRTKPYQTLRVSFGNALFRKGVALDIIAEWMGNSVKTLRTWYIGSTEYSSDINF